MKRKPNPHPQSPSQARAKSIAFVARESITNHNSGCLCDVCVLRRIAYVAGWRACRVAGRKGKR